MVHKPKAFSDRNKIIATALVLVFGAILLKVLDKGPDTRAHTPLEEITRKGNKNIFPLLTFTPDSGVSLENDTLATSLTEYIMRHTDDKKISDEVAEKRAEYLLLGSALFDVPLDDLIGQGHLESHFGTEGEGEECNMFNIGNTGTKKRTFAHHQVGVFAACTNIANRIYRYSTVFPHRKHLDYKAIWLNRDSRTGWGFVANQANFKKKNPFLYGRNPLGAYMADPDGLKKIEGIIEDIDFLTEDDCRVERVRDMVPNTFYYEKSITFKQRTYHTFTLLMSGDRQKVGVLKKNLADSLQVRANEITLFPYDYDWNDTKSNDVLVSNNIVVYVIYRKRDPH